MIVTLGPHHRTVRIGRSPLSGTRMAALCPQVMTRRARHGRRRPEVGIPSGPECRGPYSLIHHFGLRPVRVWPRMTLQVSRGYGHQHLGYTPTRGRREHRHSHPICIRGCCSIQERDGWRRGSLPCPEFREPSCRMLYPDQWSFSSHEHVRGVSIAL